MKNVVIILMLLTWSLGLSAQIFTFSTDVLEQGYYNRPYDRYEAEPGYCESNGVFLPSSDNQTLVQSEASHQQAVNLCNIGDYVQWTVGNSGRGLTLRFSLPDSSTGTGTEGKLAIVLNNVTIDTLCLSSYWAWQYTARNGNYPDNTPGSGKMVRMRFDEIHKLLSRECPAGSTLKLVKLDNADVDYTIDFMELEPVGEPLLFSDVQSSNKVEYHPATDGDLATFVKNNGGKTIYLPQGKIECANRIYMDKPNTQLIGAGMWYTEVFYTASSDHESTHNKRGIEANKDNLLVEGIFFNTINNKRYYQNNDSKQVGKAFMGSWGKHSVIRNCWAEHFECGGWIADYSGYVSEDLLVEGCRFRNNYADGLNCAQASTRHTVRFCSFRNNGDDDMASWTSARRCINVEFAYCTAENNWRASSLGFFGGTGHKAHHIAIFDALESGVRVNSDFSGLGFGDTATIYIHDITVQHCGCKSGTVGTSGDFWGNKQGALTVCAASNYDVKNVTLENIVVNDSRGDAIYLRGGNGKKINNLVLQDIRVDGAVGYGIYYGGAQGTALYCGLEFTGCTLGEQNTHMPTFVIDECITGLDETSAQAPDGPFYNLLGQPVDCSYHGLVICRGQKFIR